MEKKNCEKNCDSVTVMLWGHLFISASIYLALLAPLDRTVTINQSKLS